MCAATDAGNFEFDFGYQTVPGLSCNVWHRPPLAPTYKAPDGKSQRGVIADSFCMSRNPFDRLASQYSYKSGVDQKNAPATCDGFSDFLDQHLDDMQSNALLACLRKGVVAPEECQYHIRARLTRENKLTLDEINDASTYSAEDCHFLPQTMYTRACETVFKLEEYDTKVAPFLESKLQLAPGAAASDGSPHLGKKHAALGASDEEWQHDTEAARDAWEMAHTAGVQPAEDAPVEDPSSDAQKTLEYLTTGDPAARVARQKVDAAKAKAGSNGKLSTAWAQNLDAKDEKAQPVYAADSYSYVDEDPFPDDEAEEEAPFPGAEEEEHAKKSHVASHRASSKASSAHSSHSKASTSHHSSAHKESLRRASHKTSSLNPSTSKEGLKESSAHAKSHAHSKSHAKPATQTGCTWANVRSETLQRVIDVYKQDFQELGYEAAPPGGVFDFGNANLGAEVMGAKLGASFDPTASDSLDDAVAAMGDWDWDRRKEIGPDSGWSWTPNSTPESNAEEVIEEITEETIEGEEVPMSTTEEVPMSTTEEVPMSTTEEVPVSTTEEVPVSTTEEVPMSTTEEVSPSLPSTPPSPPTGVTEIHYCGNERGPECSCPGGSIYFASRSYPSLDEAVVAGKFSKKDVPVDAPPVRCELNEFTDPAYGQGKGCWCVPEDWEPEGRVTEEPPTPEVEEVTEEAPIPEVEPKTEEAPAPEESSHFEEAAEAPKESFHFEEAAEGPEESFHFREAAEAPEESFHFQEAAEAPEESFHFEEAAEGPEESFHFQETAEAPEESFHFEGAKTAEAPEESFHFEETAEGPDTSSGFEDAHAPAGSLEEVVSDAEQEFDATEVAQEEADSTVGTLGVASTGQSVSASYAVASALDTSDFNAQLAEQYGAAEDVYALRASKFSADAALAAARRVRARVSSLGADDMESYAASEWSSDAPEIARLGRKASMGAHKTKTSSSKTSHVGAKETNTSSKTSSSSHHHSEAVKKTSESKEVSEPESLNSAQKEGLLAISRAHAMCTKPLGNAFLGQTGFDEVIKRRLFEIHYKHEEQLAASAGEAAQIGMRKVTRPASSGLTNLRSVVTPESNGVFIPRDGLKQLPAWNKDAVVNSYSEVAREVERKKAQALVEAARVEAAMPRDLTSANDVHETGVIRRVGQSTNYDPSRAGRPRDDDDIQFDGFDYESGRVSEQAAWDPTGAKAWEREHDYGTAGPKRFRETPEEQSARKSSQLYDYQSPMDSA